MLPLAFAAALTMGSVSLASAQSTSAAPDSTASQADGNLQMSHQDWRTTKLDGATVYNEQGNSLGTINDMLMNSSGKITNVVLSAGSFLGMSGKYIEVPFEKLKFEPSKGNPSSSGGTSADSANGHDYSIVLPGVTKNALTSMTAFTY